MIHDIFDTSQRIPINGTTATICSTAFRTTCELMQPSGVVSTGNASALAWDITFDEGWSAHVPYDYYNQQSLRIIPAPVSTAVTTYRQILNWVEQANLDGSPMVHYVTLLAPWNVMDNTTETSNKKVDAAIPSSASLRYSGLVYILC
jgi:hypothetical protein